MGDFRGAASKIDHNEQETFYMKGLFFPAQIYNFSHPCSLLERIRTGLSPHGDWIKGIGGLYSFEFRKKSQKHRSCLT